VAKSKGIKSIAFPSISTGAYRYPLNRAVRIALGEINRFINQNSLPDKISIVCFDTKTQENYQTATLKEDSSHA